MVQSSVMLQPNYLLFMYLKLYAVHHPELYQTTQQCRKATIARMTYAINTLKRKMNIRIIMNFPHLIFSYLRWWSWVDTYEWWNVKLRNQNLDLSDSQNKLIVEIEVEFQMNFVVIFCSQTAGLYYSFKK